MSEEKFKFSTPETVDMSRIYHQDILNWRYENIEFIETYGDIDKYEKKFESWLFKLYMKDLEVVKITDTVKAVTKRFWEKVDVPEMYWYFVSSEYLPFC